MRKISVFLAASAATLMLPQQAHAFGLKTHLWIGQQIIDDLERDCRIEVAGVRESVAPELCRSILENRQAFLAGVIGPDGFPDLITGQTTTHPGIPSDWQTSDWLNHLFAEAPEGEQLAFAAGFLVHAGSDTFAHSYVNGYAGDIFVLTDGERAVELRHFLLEKYIDARLPVGVPDPAQLEVPAEFVRDRLIYDPDAARVSGKAGALHIPAMWGMRQAVGELTESLDDIEAETGRVLANVVTEGAELQVKLADGEAALTTAEIGLNGAEASLTAQQQALDLAKGALDSAIDAVEDNDLLIIQSEAQARAARAAIDAAESAATEATGRLRDLEHAVVEFERLQARLPSTITREIVDRVPERVCVSWGIRVCLSWRTVIRLVRRTITIPNEAYERAVNQLSDARKKLNDAKYTIAQRAVVVAAEGAREASALQAKAQAEAARAGLNTARAGVQAAYDVEKAKYDLQLTATREARGTVVALREEIERFRNRIVDLDSIREEIARLVAQSNVLSFYTRNWERGMDVAGAEYVEAGLDAARKMATMEGGIISVYSRWLTCYGGAFTPVPYQLGEFGCSLENFYATVNRQIDEFLLRNLPAPFDDLYRRYLDLSALVRNRVRDEAQRAMVELAKLAAPDATTAAFMDVLANPQSANAAKLRDAYAQVGDAGGKALLTFADVTTHVDADIGLVDGTLTPARFNALRYGLSLSKLALLDRTGMRRFVWRLGGNPNSVGPDAPGRWSILTSSLRSIDGNHQWQPFGLPYARSAGPAEPQDADKRRHGWGPGDSRGGMSLFIDPALRTTVFRRVFPAPVEGSLAVRPELAPGTYPFASCAANPFPVTFLPDGSSAANDPTCTSSGADQPPTPALGQTLRRFFRSIAGALGFGPR